MKIQDFCTLQMVSTDKAHFGQSKIQPLTQNKAGTSPIQAITVQIRQLKLLQFSLQISQNLSSHIFSML